MVCITLAACAMVESGANLNVDCKLLQDATLKKFKQYKTLLQSDDKSNDM